MKKIILAGFLSLILGISSVNMGLAQSVQSETAPSIAPYIGDNVFGQNQYYSVVFDGEGEAAVAVKLLLQNNSKDAISSTILEIPGVGIRLIKAVQEVYSKEQYCYRWEPNVCTENGKYGCLKYEQACSDWRWQVKTWDPLYYTLDPQAEELSDSVKYTIELAKSIEEQDQTAILLYYKAPAYAKKSLGVFNFKFETVKVPYDVDSVRIAVNVQEGLYLKGGKAETQYRASPASTFEAVSLDEAGVQNKGLSDFSNQITYVSGYVKTTSGLDPWESFKVEGKYAESRFALNKWIILGWVLGILAFLTGVGFLVWFLVKRAKKRSEKLAKIDKSHLLPLKIVGVGIGSAFGVIILGILGALLIQFISQHVYYQYSGLVSLLLALVEGILILALVFGPSVYFGIKYGASKGVWVFAVLIVSLLILGVLAAVILSIFNGVRIYPTVQY